MAEKDTPKTINRRNLIRGLSAGAGASLATGIAAADDKSSKRIPDEAERAKWRAPYEDFETASSIIIDETAALRSKLKEMGIVPSTDPAALKMDKLDTETRVAPLKRGIGLDDVRVKTLKTKEYGKQVNIDTWVKYNGYLVMLNYTVTSEVASAMVVKDKKIQVFMRTNDSGVEVVKNEIQGNRSNSFSTQAVPLTCTDEVCDDCCGTFDCDAEVKGIYDPDNSRQTFCNCLVSVPGACCEPKGCGTLCLC